VSPPAPRPRHRTAGRWTWIDLRLVPAALSVWAGCLLAPLLTPAWLLGCAAAAVVLAVILTAAARRGRNAAVALALGVLAALAVTSVTAAVRAAEREASPLRTLAESGRSVTAVLELDGDPRRLPGPGEPRVMADATVTTLVDGPRVDRLDDPVLLFAAGSNWSALVPGQDVRVRIRVALPDRRDGVVAVVSARGPPTLVGAPGGVLRLAAALREGLAASAARVLDPRPAGLLPGLVVGDTSAMDPVLVEDFRRAGLTHLTAVSGANVG
jgi:competence protein ComEC